MRKAAVFLSLVLLVGSLAVAEVAEFVADGAAVSVDGAGTSYQKGRRGALKAGRASAPGGQLDAVLLGDDRQAGDTASAREACRNFGAGWDIPDTDAGVGNWLLPAVALGQKKDGEETYFIWARGARVPEGKLLVVEVSNYGFSVSQDDIYPGAVIPVVCTTGRLPGPGGGGGAITASAATGAGVGEL